MNELTTIQEGNLAITFEEGFAQKKSFFSTIPYQGGTRKDKVKVYNAMTNAEKSLGEEIGEIIEVVDIIAHEAKVNNQDTGEIMEMIRIILVDVDGVSHHTVSKGITENIKTLIQLFEGEMPSKEEPWKLKIRQKKIGDKRNLLHVEFIEE